MPVKYLLTEEILFTIVLNAIFLFSPQCRGTDKLVIISV